MERVRRALISVTDKIGLVDFALKLKSHSVELVSTGGTARVLRAAGLEVRDISDLTGFPEILGGRVKTLHPKVHGGILAIRNSQAHRREVDDNAIEYIDLVVVNLYPFRQTIAREDVSAHEAIENIDIGGPSMIRSAAKNFEHVAVVVDPSDYSRIAASMDANGGGIPLADRLILMRKAFQTTARYDMTVAEFFSDHVALDDDQSEVSVSRSVSLPASYALLATKETDLRYGENPQQRAALYVIDPGARGVATAEKLQGKELSFNNLVDLDAAWALVSEFSEPACVIIKHTNPCGAATGADCRAAFEKALATDPVSAYGGIVGFNETVTEEAAAALARTFFEAIVAPDYEKAAMSVLAAKKNLRVLKLGTGQVPRVAPDSGAKSTYDLGYDIRMISGGLLVQDPDRARLDLSKIRVVTERRPSDEELQAMRFAWLVAKHVKSNAIIYAREGQLVGVGAGQMSRVDSVKIGAMKAHLPLEGTVLASDAFFPFRDGVDEAARAGVTAIIQPGGSVRDEEVIAATNEHAMAMVFTGIRHFKH